MLYIIIVNWNVRELLAACLRSLQAHPAATHAQTVIVVDNASSDGSVEMLKRDFPDAHVIANATNRGFTGGNNDGLRYAQSLIHPQPLPRGGGNPQAGVGVSGAENYFLLLNPDTEVTPGALDALLACADAQPNAGVVGPQLRYPDGSLQSSRRRFPSLKTALFESTWLQSHAPRKLLDDFYMRDLPDDQPCECDWLVGAALLIRASAIQQTGGFDENFFMYSEELDLCKRLHGAGWRVVYCPSALITHHEGKSSGQASARRMITFNTSKVKYFRKHHGGAQAGILRAALLGMFLWQMGLEAGKYILGSQRPMRAGRIRAYAGVLRSGLV
jgi:GT2 family glycosyltransferase